MAQEVLSTFDGEADELSLQPGTGDIFEVIAICSRKEKGVEAIESCCRVNF